MIDGYIRKQDAVDALDELRVNSLDAEKGLLLLSGIAAASDIIESIKSADVAPVVRCKNCENWQTDWNPSIPDRHYCAVMDSMMKADDFCSYGERREE